MCDCNGSKLAGYGNMVQGYGEYGHGGPIEQDLLGLGDMYGFGDLDPNALLPPSRDVLENETRKLQDSTKQLAHDWFDNPGQVSKTQLSRWNSYVADLKAWDWGPAWLSHIITFTWRDDLLVFQNRFNGFLDEFNAAGVGSGAAPVTFIPTPPSTFDKLVGKATAPIAEAASTAKWVAIAGGISVLGLLFFATHQAGSIGRAIAPLAVRNPRRRRRRR